MKLVQLALSACLVVGSMAGISSTASAAGGYGSGHGGGHHASGHRGGSRHGGGHRSRGHSSRGHGNGGAFIAGAVIGALAGWSGGYGYPRAQQQRYGRHHRPYYAPQRHRGGHHYRGSTPRRYHGHTRRHYSYSGGGGNGYHQQAYQTRGGNSGCHPVNKYGHWNGRSARVGGTMCYNSHGAGYVVSGSRYLIHYR